MNGAVRAGLAQSLLGSSFAVTQLFLGYPTLTGQAARYAVAAGILAILTRRRPTGRPAARRDLLRLGALAATGLVAFNVCVLAALRQADPAVLGTVIGGTPLLLAILGPVLAGRRPSVRLAAAGATVVLGVALVQGGGHATPAGLGWACGALAGEVAFSLLAAPALGELGPVRVSAWACALAVPQLVVLCLVGGEWRRWRWPTPTEAGALLYIAVVLTVGAFILWFSGLDRLGVERAGMFAGLLPVASLVGAVVMDRTVPGPAQVAGVLVVAGGLLLGLGTRPRESGAGLGGAELVRVGEDRAA